MIMRRLSLILALMIGLAAPAAHAQEDRCAIPDMLRYSDAALPRLAAKVKAGGPVEMTVLGTSSSLRESKGLPRTYVAGLVEELSAQFPQTEFRITNLSERMQSAPQMAGRIKAEILAAKPDLLVWQTGNVDAARHLDVNSFSAALDEGLRHARIAGIEVVLVAPQFRGRLAALVDAGAYDEYMARIGESWGVPVFPRYDIMRHWAEQEKFDLRADNQAEQMREAEAQNRCLARLLAGMVRRAADRPVK